MIVICKNVWDNRLSIQIINYLLVRNVFISDRFCGETKGCVTPLYFSPLLFSLNQTHIISHLSLLPISSLFFCFQTKCNLVNVFIRNLCGWYRHFFCANKKFRLVGSWEFTRVKITLKTQRALKEVITYYQPIRSSHRQ